MTSDRLPAPLHAPADGASLFRPSFSAAPAPAPTDLNPVGVGVTPNSVATLPATDAPREGQSAVHAPTVAIRTCIQATVGASLGEVTP